MRVVQIGFLILLSGLSLAAIATSHRLGIFAQNGPSDAICMMPLSDQVPDKSPTGIRPMSDCPNGA